MQTISNAETNAETNINNVEKSENCQRIVILNAKGFNYNKVSELVGILRSTVGCLLKKKSFKREVLKTIPEVESRE